MSGKEADYDPNTWARMYVGDPGETPGSWPSPAHGSPLGSERANGKIHTQFLSFCLSDFLFSLLLLPSHLSPTPVSPSPYNSAFEIHQFSFKKQGLGGEYKRY